MRREFPSGLRVQLQEHDVAAYWGAEGSPTLVNSQGQVFEADPDEVEDESLPRLLGAAPERAAEMLDMARRLAPLLAPLGSGLETLELTGNSGWRVLLASGAVLKSRLLVAADSRFSTTRRAMGIAADLHDFGRSMLVCCMTHDEPHNHAAWEWFDYGQTLALLPMNDDPATGEHRSSVVLTLPSREIDPLLTLEPSAFNQEMAIRFDRRLGTMTLASTRHVYPLVAVYPRRLVAQRFACVGDAAVGMHPVTAHGFNFGLLSIDNLAATVRAAHATGSDVAAPAGLARYEQTQRRATLPLYLATQLVTQLYTRDTPPARALRTLALHVGERFTPFKRMIAASLTGGA